MYRATVVDMSFLTRLRSVRSADSEMSFHCGCTQAEVLEGDVAAVEVTKARTP